MNGFMQGAGGMSAFMEGFMRTREMLQQRKRLTQQDEIAAQDRQRQIERQTKADQFAQEDQAWQQQQRLLSLGQLLNQSGAQAETLPEAEGAIDSTFGMLTPEQQTKLAPVRDQSLRGAVGKVSNRQKAELKRWVSDELMKSQYIAENTDADPEITQAMPARIRQLAESVTGQTSFKKSDLLRLTETMEQAKPPSSEVSWQIKEGVGPDGKPGMFRINPKTGETQPVRGIRPEPPRTPPSDPEIAELRKELLRLQVQNAGKPDEPSQAQFTAGGFASRIEQAEPTITKVAPSVQNMSLLSFGTQTEGWFAKPTFQSNDIQSYMQAARNFINAVLRRESGAVISPEEFREAKAQYLPVPGDTEEALALKAANRKLVFENLKRAAGSGYQAAPTLGGHADMIEAIDPSGKRHRAPKGTPLPQGWKLAGGM